MVSKFLKTFKENILTSQLLMSNILIKMKYIVEDSSLLSIPEYSKENHGNWWTILNKKNQSDKWVAILSDMANVKDFFHEPKYNFSLTREINNFLTEKLSKQDFIYYICRNAINFTFSEIENYFFKCFKELYVKYPEKIQGKKLKLKRLIEQDFDGQRLLEVAAYDEAEKIHRTSIKDVLYEAEKNHGIIHQIKPREMEKLDALKQIRNIFTHRDGTITRRYLKKVRKSDFKLGEKFILSLEMVNYYQSLSISVLTKFDKALLKKYPNFEL